MRLQIKVIGLMAMVFISGSLHAAQTVEKPVTQINFNKMIDESGAERSQAESKVEARLDKTRPEVVVLKDKEKQQVLDFVDIEVNLGPERPVVDRRFNSIDEPKFLDL